MLLGARTSAGSHWPRRCNGWRRARRIRRRPRARPTTPTPTASAARPRLGYRRAAVVGRLARHARRSPSEGRGNRFAGDGIRADASFSQAAIKLDARLARARRRVALVRGAGSPARRLDRLDHAPGQRPDRRGLAARPHRAHARRRQRGDAAGAGRSLLPGRRRRPAQSRPPARAGPLGARGRPSPRARPAARRSASAASSARWRT